MSAVQTREHRVTFPRVLASEWIKLASLRSTIWCGVLIVVLTLAAGLLLSVFVNAGGVAPPASRQDSLQVTVVTLGARFTQLIACIFGVLVIGGEYATGMIRTTFISVPRRWPAILAKLIVLALATFLVTEIATFLTLAVAAAILPAHGITVRLDAASVIAPMLGAGLYLALVAVLACLIGVIVRNSAAGIAIVLGLILVVPTVLTIIAALTRAAWIQNVGAVLPSSAGERLYSYTADAPGGVVGGVLTLTPGFAILVLLGWIVVAALIAFPLVARRDA